MTSGLTEIQRRFVEAYMADPNGAAAAKAAGSKAKNLYAAASEFLRNPNVRLAISERIAADPRIATREERLKFLSAFMVDPAREDGIRLKACDQLAKSCGDYIERHEISGPGGSQLAVMVYLPENLRGHGKRR